MKNIAPPAWMERLLKLFLDARERETISGDLHEEFSQRKLSRPGSAEVELWYLRQIVSFVPHRLLSLFAQPRLLTLFCIFTALCGTWLGAMDLRLRHAGYKGQTVIAGMIVGEALLTLAALRYGRNALLRSVSMLGCGALLWLAAKALLAAFRGGDIEGYVLLIAVSLILQSVLTVCTLPAGGDPHVGRA